VSVVRALAVLVAGGGFATVEAQASKAIPPERSCPQFGGKLAPIGHEEDA
jgi:hypothetical protein